METKYKYLVGNLAEILQQHNNISTDDFIMLDERTYALTGLEKFVKFISNPKPLHIISDSDCDGLSSLAVASLYLNGAGEYFSFDVLKRSDRNPNDFFIDETHKYLLLDCASGLNPEYFEKYDILVIDHHEPQFDYSELPVINPHVQNQHDRLCTSSLAYIYFSAYYNDNEVKQIAVQYAAIGTVADMVPLVNDNRVIVQAGLCELNENPASTLRPLLSFLKLEHINEASIGFYIAPTINAASRFNQTEHAYNGYIKGSEYDVKQLLKLNQKRKKDTKSSVDNADIKVYDKCVIAVIQDSSVAGLVATKVSYLYGKPTIAINISNGNINFSIRSLNAINVVDFLAHYNIRGGGHPAAGGGSVDDNQYEWLCNSFCQYCEDNANLEVTTSNDYIAIRGKHINVVHEEMDTLRPFGMGFALPNFVGIFKVAYFYKMGVHYKVRLVGKENEFEAMYFFPERDIEKGETITAVFEITGPDSIIIRKLL